MGAHTECEAEESWGQFCTEKARARQTASDAEFIIQSRRQTAVKTSECDKVTRHAETATGLTDTEPTLSENQQPLFIPCPNCCTSPNTTTAFYITNIIHVKKTTKNRREKINLSSSNFSIYIN